MMEKGDRRLVIVIDEPAHTGLPFDDVVARALVGYAHRVMEGKGRVTETLTDLVPGVVLTVDFQDSYHG